MGFLLKMERSCSPTALDGSLYRYSDRISQCGSIPTYRVLTVGWPTLRGRLGEDHPDFISFLGLLDILKTLFSSGESEERPLRSDSSNECYGSLYPVMTILKRFVDENIRTINGIPGKAESFNLWMICCPANSFKLCLLEGWR